MSRPGVELVEGARTLTFANVRVWVSRLKVMSLTVTRLSAHGVEAFNVNVFYTSIVACNAIFRGFEP